MASVLRVLFGDESDSRKLTLVSGIPNTVEELYTTIKTYFQVQEDFRIQYFDADFNAFMNMTSTTEIKDKSTVKVIFSPPVAPEETFITLYPVSEENAPLPSHVQQMTSTPETSRIPTPISSVISSCSDDTLVTLSPHPSPEITIGLSSWPQNFVIPKFTYDAELELQQKNTEFKATGNYFTPGVKLKTVILDFLAQEMLKYTKYPQDYHCEEVAAALTKAHPCLFQLGEKSGFWGWKQSLKNKMQNYRTKLGRLGDPEIRVNSLKHKRHGKGKTAAKIKKPKKAEVNYIPIYSKGETEESLEIERVGLLAEFKKTDNEAIIKAKMEKTFSLRRLEVVDQRPRVVDIKERWPALFTVNGIKDEFIRITTKPLFSKFLAQFDHFTEKLLDIFRPKGGAKGVKIKRLLELSDGHNDINITREYVLKCLIIYLNEEPVSLFRNYSISEVMEAEDSVEDTIMGIFVFRRSEHGIIDDIWIIIEGVKVVTQVESVIMAFILMFGLIYALDLNYPDKLKYTFEFIQKIIMVMDSHKLNTKIQQLKMKMLM